MNSRASERQPLPSRPEFPENQPHRSVPPAEMNAPVSKDPPSCNSLLSQPAIEARTKKMLSVDGLLFKDLNGDGQLDVYEDWRRPVAERVEDLLGKMTPQEKAGMLLIQTLNALPGGLTCERHLRFVNDEKMTRFILRNPVVRVPVPGEGNPFSGPQISVAEAAAYTNRVQAMAEATRLGIPALFKSNARNHYEQDARPGINVAAGAFTSWCKEAGLAAMRDMRVVADFAQTMRQEWTAIGLRGMYGYMADLCTEPRWNRAHETFTEDADLAAEIIGTVIRNLQGTTLSPGGVALSIKHFPGGGPQEGGGDPHYWFGRHQVYPGDNFEGHLKPFKAAIAAGASSMMVYYGIPVGQRWLPNDVGMAFSKGIVTDLLRDTLGFKGYVNTDTGIIGPRGANRAWGLADKDVDDLLVIALDAGNDLFSGFDNMQQILSLVESGRITQARVDESVRRLLREQFELGLFENPYCDTERAEAIVGAPHRQARADAAQRRSMVSLKNDHSLLPLPAGAHLYTLGLTAQAVQDAGFRVTAGDAAGGAPRAAVPADVDFAVVRVHVANPVLPLTDDNEPEPIPGKSPCTMFGGALPGELSAISFTEMARARSWQLTPPLDDIRAVMREVGAERTVLAIYFRQPYVLDEACGLRDAAALIALFGASDSAVMDVVSGRASAAGRLPFSLATSIDAVLRHPPDVAGYPASDALYPFGAGC